MAPPVPVHEFKAITNKSFLVFWTSQTSVNLSSVGEKKIAPKKNPGIRTLITSETCILFDQKCMISWNTTDVYTSMVINWMLFMCWVLVWFFRQGSSSGLKVLCKASNLLPLGCHGKRCPLHCRSSCCSKSV